jgi:hypothetical protein
MTDNPEPTIADVLAEYRWRRIEPGYYKLQRRAAHEPNHRTYGAVAGWQDAGYEIANMRGSSVRWSGLIVNAWEVRTPTGTATTVRTKADAQAYTMQLLDVR